MLPVLQYQGRDERGRERYGNTVAVRNALVSLRKKQPSELTAEERSYLLQPAHRSILARNDVTAGQEEYEPISPGLENLGVFRKDVPRKAGSDMGQVLKLRGLLNTKVSPEAFKAAGVPVPKVPVTVENLYTGGFALKPMQAAKVAYTQWAMQGNDVKGLLTELPALRVLTLSSGDTVERQRVRDSVDQSVRFFEKVNSGPLSTYKKTAFNHVVEGQAPNETSLLRNSGLPSTYPTTRMVGEAGREFFTRPDEYLANKATPYNPPTTQGQALRETLIGSLPSILVPSVGGTPDDALTNVPLAAAAVSTIKPLQNMASPLVTGLRATSELPAALRSAEAGASTVDDFLKAAALAPGNPARKALGRGTIENFLKQGGQIPDELIPFVKKTPSGEVVFDIPAEAAKGLGLEPLQVKQLAETNYAAQLKGDWQTTSAIERKLADEAAGVTKPAGPTQEPYRTVQGRVNQSREAAAAEQAARQAQEAADQAAQQAQEAEYLKLVDEMRMADEAGQLTKSAELEDRMRAMEKANATLRGVRGQQAASKQMATLSAEEAAARTKAQQLAKQSAEARAGLAETGPRPTFEPGSPEEAARIGTPLPTRQGQKEKVLGELQAGVPDEAALASRGAKQAKLDLSGLNPEVGAPVRSDAATKQIAQDFIAGKKLTPEQETYASAYGKEIEQMVEAERTAAKIAGDVPPPTAAKTAEAAAAQTTPAPTSTPASTATAVDDAAAAAGIKSAPLPTVPIKEGPSALGRALKWGTGLGAAGWLGSNLMDAFKQGNETDYARFLRQNPDAVREMNAPQEPSVPEAQVPQIAFPAPQPAQPAPFQSNMNIPTIPQMRPEQTTLVQPEAGFDWRSTLGNLANAISVGAETYNTGTDARRPWNELALQNAAEAKRMSQMDAAAMQDFYNQRQAMVDARLKQQSFGYESLADRDKKLAELALDRFLQQAQGKSALEVQQMAEMLRQAKAASAMQPY